MSATRKLAGHNVKYLNIKASALALIVATAVIAPHILVIAAVVKLAIMVFAEISEAYNESKTQNDLKKIAKGGDYLSEKFTQNTVTSTPLPLTPQKAFNFANFADTNLGWGQQTPNQLLSNKKNTTTVQGIPTPVYDVAKDDFNRGWKIAENETSSEGAGAKEFYDKLIEKIGSTKPFAPEIASLAMTALSQTFDDVVWHHLYEELGKDRLMPAVLQDSIEYEFENPEGSQLFASKKVEMEFLDSENSAEVIGRITYTRYFTINIDGTPPVVNSEFEEYKKG